MKRLKAISIIILIFFLVSNLVYAKNKYDKTGELLNVGPMSNIGVKMHPKKVNLQVITDYTNTTILNDIKNRLTTLNADLSEKGIDFYVNGELFNQIDIGDLSKYAINKTFLKEYIYTTITSNNNPNIKLVKPQELETIVSGEYYTPRIKFSDLDGNNLTCSYSIDDGVLTESKTITNTSTEQEIVFSSISTSNLSIGTHKMTITAFDGKVTTKGTLYFRIMPNTYDMENYSMLISDSKVNIEKSLYEYLLMYDYTNYGVSPLASWDYKDSSIQDSLSIRSLISNTKGKLFNIGQFQECLDSIKYKYFNQDVDISILTDYTDTNKLSDLRTKLIMLESDLKQYDINLSINGTQASLIDNNKLITNKKLLSSYKLYKDTVASIYVYDTNMSYFYYIRDSNIYQIVNNGNAAKITNTNDISSIYSDDNHLFSVKKDGTLWVYTNYNTSSAEDLNKNYIGTIPIQVSGVNNVKKVCANDISIATINDMGEFSYTQWTPKNKGYFNTKKVQDLGSTPIDIISGGINTGINSFIVLLESKAIIRIGLKDMLQYYGYIQFNSNNPDYEIDKGQIQYGRIGADSLPTTSSTSQYFLVNKDEKSYKLNFRLAISDYYLMDTMPYWIEYSNDMNVKQTYAYQTTSILLDTNGNLYCDRGLDAAQATAYPLNISDVDFFMPYYINRDNSNSTYIHMLLVKKDGSSSTVKISIIPFFTGYMVMSNPINEPKFKNVGTDIYGLDTSSISNNSQDTDKYFIYLSESKDNDYSQGWGRYYSFGTLNSNFLNFLKNNEYTRYAISPSGAWDYKLPESNIQDITIRQLVGNNLNEGMLFDVGQVEGCLLDIKNKILAKIGMDGKPFYVCSDESVEYVKSYKDYEDDPQNDERFKYNHDWTLFENNKGSIDNNNTWINEEITQFSHTGKYVISHQVQDNPTGRIPFNNYNKWSTGENQITLISHYRPVADFDYFINNRTLALTIQAQSYDLDHYSESSKGIVSSKWKWKNIKDTNWTYSYPPSTLILGETYAVSLEVKDKEGAWSYPNIKVFKAGENHKPIARFTLQKLKMMRGEINTITDLSYDPNMDPLIEWHWRLLDSNNLLVTDFFGTKPNLSTLMPGKYKLELTVRDNPVIPPSYWSDPYTLDFEITDNLKLNGNLSPNPAKRGQKIKITAITDGFAKNLTFYFPYEITSLDSITVFPIYKQIVVEDHHVESIDYYLPMETEYTLDRDGTRLREPYLITVVAGKDGESKSVDLQLDVMGNIYDGIKTEMK